MTRMIGEQDYTTVAQDLLTRALETGERRRVDVMVAIGETLSRYRSE